MSATLRDIRYGFRSLVKSPGLSFIAIFALTLGIGLTTTMFSIVYGALMKGLPFPEGDRIASVFRENMEPHVTQGSIPLPDIDRFRTEQRSFSEIAAMTSGTMNVSGRGTPERFDGAWVSANMFHLLSVQPALGRDFRAGEDAPQGPRVAIISYTMWENRYAKAASVIGQNIRINEVPYEIIGVMPAKFAFPTTQQLWLPIQTDPLATSRANAPQYQVVGKLKPGVTLAQATADLDVTEQRIVREHQDTDRGFTASVIGFTDGYIGKQPRQLLSTMLGAVFFVLLIACSNVANLLIDRAVHRSKDVGIRAALGASRAAIVRQFLAESFLLALAGTALGLVVAYVGIGLFNRAIIDTQVPFFIDIRLHSPVLVFAALVALVATVFSGVIPAVQSSRADINEVLKDETRGTSSLRIGKISKVLVMFEVALSCGLLVAAGLTIKSVTKLRTMDPGFATRDVFTARVGFPVANTDTVQQRQYFAQLAERAAQLPGVSGAAVSSGLPGARQGLGSTEFAVEGKTYAERQYPSTRSLAVSPGFFGTLSIPLQSGRLFTSGDRADALPVAIVTDRFARQFFGGETPLGRRIRYGNGQSTEPWLTIVGVVPTIFGGNQDDPRPALVFRPLEQAHTNFVYIAARATSGNAMSLAAPIRDAASALNADTPLYWLSSLDTAIATQLWFVRVFGSMFMIFGFVALFLASVGLYAVMSFSVTRRSREVGIRMALGAQARDVIRMIVGQGLVQVGAGLIAGLGLAVGISTLLSSILFEVDARDPVVFGGVAAVLVLTSALACLVPAMRATRVDPLGALRSD